MAVSPARRCALAVVRRTFEEGAYTDRALRAEAQRLGLEGRELAFATALAFGTVQRAGTLDHLIERLADRPPAGLDPPVLAALRLGLFQIAFLDGVAPHAAVDQSVGLVRGPARGLVNAVLRRATREAPALLAALDDSTPEGAAIAHSHPEWIARMWWDALGPDGARALMARDNQPAENALRVNTLVAEAAQIAAELPATPDERLPEALVLDAPFDVGGNDRFAAGAITPQSRASVLVGRVLGPRPGERVLDLCSAPGAKATHLAALMGDDGEVVAVESNPARADELHATVDRMRASCVEVRTGDARDDQGTGYDRVLVDPPCSGLGTLSGRPDLRWRASPERVAELATLQREILGAAARAVRPGGIVVYSTCTISPPENEEAVADVLAVHPELAPDDLLSDAPLWKHPSVPHHLLLLPHRDGTDGFFIARLRRAAG
ncbi:MAG: 16S rRNA (cytosine(967)-C(5))-methyltransferase RsmB [Actinomycetota bacterium]|nr:16S rRNA (cytosine(967)-C(5))-methyltransferase RsmB [Actinomycetota bacterium]